MILTLIVIPPVYVIWKWHSDVKRRRDTRLQTDAHQRDIFDTTPDVTIQSPRS
jgi:hypothetical protein